MNRDERKSFAEDSFAFAIAEEVLSEKSRSERDERDWYESLRHLVKSFVSCKAVCVQDIRIRGETSNEPRVVIPQRSSKMFIQILNLDLANFSSFADASTTGLEAGTPSMK